MCRTEIVQLFCDRIPRAYPRHMFCAFSEAAARGQVLPFTYGLFTALERIDAASPGYAEEIIRRMAAIDGTGEPQYEALIQICAEIYVTVGAVDSADCDSSGNKLFSHEPGAAGGRNPEFEACSNGTWYAVEAKAPQLIQHSRNRYDNPWQLTTRLPRELGQDRQVTLPRDNPVKDFLISANEKFQAYSAMRPDAFRILTIVWDDFVNEPVSALLHPHAGLLTPNSFFRDDQRNCVTFPFIDGILLCRYQHQILHVTRTEPMVDGEIIPFIYAHPGFPPKALIANPYGREIPDGLLGPLNATRIGDCVGAEYNPMDLVMWIGGETATQS